jgi:hypothetical protein
MNEGISEGRKWNIVEDEYDSNNISAVIIMCVGVSWLVGCGNTILTR